MALFPAGDDDAWRRRRRRRTKTSVSALLPLALFLFLLLLTTTAAQEKKSTREAEREEAEEAAVEASTAAAAALLASAAASSGGNNSTDPIAAELAWEAAERQRMLFKQMEEEEEEEREEEKAERERESEKGEGKISFSSARFSSSSSPSPFEKDPSELEAEREAEKMAEKERELVDRVIGEAAAASARQQEVKPGAHEEEEGEKGEEEKEKEDKKRDPIVPSAYAPSAAQPLSSSSSSSSSATKGAPAGEPPPTTPKDNKNKPPPSTGDVDENDDDEPPPYNPAFPSPCGIGVPRSGGAMLLSETELAVSPFAKSDSGGGSNNSSRRPLLSLSAALPPLYDPSFGGRGLPSPNRPGVPKPPPLVKPPLLNSFAAKQEYAAYLRAGFRDDMQAAENERPKPRNLESSSDGTTPPSSFPPSPLASVASATRPNEYGARTDDIPVVYATRVDVLASAAANKAKDGLEASRTVVVDEDGAGNGTLSRISLSFAANAAVDQPSRRFRPPDQSLCVGNGVVITGNNLILRTWDANTGAPLQGPIAQPDFFGLDGNFSDPSCIYDAQDSKRFFVSVFRFNEVQPKKYSQFVVAVSKTSDPADGFLGPYVIRNDGLDPRGEKPLPGLERCGGGFSKKANATAEPGCLGDYPSVGLDAHSLWSGFNLFRTAPLEGYAGTLVVALSKKDLVSGRAVTPAAAFYSNFDQTLAYTVQPTQTQPGTQHETSRNGTIYLVSTAPVVQSEPNVPALAAWAATGTSLLSEDDFPSSSTAASSNSSSSSSVDPFPGIPRISNAAVVPTPAYRDPGAFKKSKLAVPQPSPGWGLDGGDARTLQHVLSGGITWTSAQTVMRVGSASAPLSIGPVYFAMLPDWETKKVVVKRRGSGGGSGEIRKASAAEATTTTMTTNDVLFFGGDKKDNKEQVDNGGSNSSSTTTSPSDEGNNDSADVFEEVSVETESYAPRLVAAGYLGAPLGRSIGRPAIVATRSGTAFIGAYMSGSDFAMSPVIAEIDLFSGPQKIMVPALSPVPLEPSNADRLFKAGDPAGGGTLRVGDYGAAVLGDDLKSAWFASEWSGGVPSPACVEQQGPTKCPSWSTYVSRVELAPESRGGGSGGGEKEKESSSSPPTAAERVRARMKTTSGGGGSGVAVGKSTSSASGSGGSRGEPFAVGGALGEPVAGGEQALAAEANKKGGGGGGKAAEEKMRPTPSKGSVAPSASKRT